MIKTSDFLVLIRGVYSYEKRTLFMPATKRCITLFPFSLETDVTIIRKKN